MNLWHHALGAAFVFAAWWASTALVLVLVWRKVTQSRLGLWVSAGLALLGAVGLYVTSRSTQSWAAYLSFVSALLLWGFHELTFLSGVVTGPRTEPASSGARGWLRFKEATLAVIHHELALAATLAVTVGLTWGAPNRAGVASFAVLWVMRLASKINIFTGVRNLNLEFVPAHLGYLKSYFRRSPFNPLLLLTIVASSATAGLLFRDARAVSETLVASLLALGALEHLFLAVPLPDAALWRWVVRRSASFADPGGLP